MEYVQEHVTTLHDLTGTVPDAPTDRAAVVVPMAEREYAGLAAERVLSELERVGPAEVIVALRAPPGKVGAFRDWLASFDLPLTVLWCNAPAVATLLAERGIGPDGDAGKGRDVWLAVGVAASDHEFVVVHDADARSYSSAYVSRLLAPLDAGFDFSKGYYARVENGRLYGRLFRLLYAPLVRALASRHDAPVLDYLGSFRYALAGEFAMTADLARSLRIEPDWGLEVGTLGEVFERVGPGGAAQVDLGTYEHDHRAVTGHTGLEEMSRHVAAALLRIAEANGVRPDYDMLSDRYRETAGRMVDGYAADAAFNGLDADPAGERSQVAIYADAIEPPGRDARLPPWSLASLSAAAVREASKADVRSPGSVRPETKR